MKKIVAGLALALVTLGAAHAAPKSSCCDTTRCKTACGKVACCDAPCCATSGRAMKLAKKASVKASAHKAGPCCSMPCGNGGACCSGTSCCG